MKLGDLIVGFFRADVPLSEVDPYRRAGTDAYALIDEVSAVGWGRLAAWNAFLLQVYGDSLIAAGSTEHYVTADIAMFARGCYALANVWLEQARKCQASDTYRFIFHVHPLPHWQEPYRTDAQLSGMRATLDTGRTRVASDLERFAGTDAQRDLLRIRLAEVDSEVGYVERLWTPKPNLDLRGMLGNTLAGGLDHAYELGQLLAQPELLLHLL